jgi:hypothetical protein
LQKMGLCRGVVLFAVPEFGIHFKCRARGRALDLELAAFLAMLKTISGLLSREKVDRVLVHSSRPEFVMGRSTAEALQATDTAKGRLIRKLLGNTECAIRYVPPRLNHALFSPADLPSLPDGKEFAPDLKSLFTGGPRMRPYQKGIRL